MKFKEFEELDRRLGLNITKTHHFRIRSLPQRKEMTHPVLGGKYTVHDFLAQAIFLSSFIEFTLDNTTSFLEDKKLREWLFRAIQYYFKDTKGFQSHAYIAMAVEVLRHAVLNHRSSIRRVLNLEALLESFRIISELAQKLDANIDSWKKNSEAMDYVGLLGRISWENSPLRFFIRNVFNESISAPLDIEKFERDVISIGPSSKISYVDKFLVNYVDYALLFVRAQFAGLGDLSYEMAEDIFHPEQILIDSSMIKEKRVFHYRYRGWMS